MKTRFLHQILSRNVMEVNSKILRANMKSKARINGETVLHSWFSIKSSQCVEYLYTLPFLYNLSLSLSSSIIWWWHPWSCPCGYSMMFIVYWISIEILGELCSFHVHIFQYIQCLNVGLRPIIRSLRISAFCIYCSFHVISFVLYILSFFSFHLFLFLLCSDCVQYVFRLRVLWVLVWVLIPVSVCIESAVYIVDDPNILNRFDRLVVARED